MNKAAVLVALIAHGLGWPAQAQAQFDPPRFRFRRLIHLPQLPGPEGFVRVPLPLEVISAAGPGLGELRVVEGEAKEIPYHLWVRRGSVERGELRPRILNLGRGPRGETTFELHLERPAAPHNRLRLTLEGDEFTSRVRLEATEDRRRWLTLVEDGLVFRLREPSRSEKLEVAYPDSIYPILRVSLEPVSGGGPRFKEARVSRLVERPGMEEMIDFVVVETQVSEEAGQRGGGTTSVISLDLGRSGIPIHALELEVDGENFSRQVDIFGRNDSDRWLSLGSRTIYRFRDGERSEQKTRFEVEGSYRFYQATILNRDSPPLSVRRVRAAFYRRELVFSARPGGQYFIYYQAPGTKAPRYDLDAITERLDLPSLPEGGLGEEEVNPTYRPPDRPFTEAHPALLWGALIVLVLVLGGLVVRAMRSAGGPG